MTVIFFLATNSYIDKTEGGGVCHEGDINSPNLIFRAVFTANFTADAVKCQCNNVSLQFTQAIFTAHFTADAMVPV